MWKKAFYFLGFISILVTLIPTKAAEDIFLILVSRGMDRFAAGGGTTTDAMSADGRYIAFISSSDILIPDDTNEEPDLFIFDRNSSSITRASIATNMENREMGGFGE